MVIGTLQSTGSNDSAERNRVRRAGWFILEHSERNLSPYVHPQKRLINSTWKSNFRLVAKKMLVAARRMIKNLGQAVRSDARARAKLTTLPLSPYRDDINLDDIIFACEFPIRYRLFRYGI